MTLLEKADSIKLRDRSGFNALMQEIGARQQGLPEDQREYFRFLQGWNSAYEGNDAAATAELAGVAADSAGALIRFRAYATLSALYTSERRYSTAFQDLSQAQSLLPQISDGGARAEGLLDAAELYGRIMAYGVLYRSAERRGEDAAALAYYRKYAAARMGYLSDISVRELAYEHMREESVARKLQVETLVRENRVLELKHQLAAKEVQATRLYGVILTLILVFIGLWAVWTKRSQLHFKSLSRIDGLTGISNRLHFIERSEAAPGKARGT